MRPLKKHPAEKTYRAAAVRAPLPRLRRSALRAPPIRRAPLSRRSLDVSATVDRLRSESISANPYEDYAIDITPEGGMRMTFKTLDQRFRRKVAAFLLWAAASVVDAWVLMPAGLHGATWLSWLLLGAAIIVNAIIVTKPFEVMRSLEIRADVLIVDGQDFFMRHRMEGPWPSFQPDRGTGEFVLSGIYGTRQVEYLRVNRFDEFDRAPEVLMAHLQYAMQQLWTPQPY